MNHLLHPISRRRYSAAPQVITVIGRGVTLLRICRREIQKAKNLWPLRGQQADSRRRQLFFYAEGTGNNEKLGTRTGFHFAAHGRNALFLHK